MLERIIMIQIHFAFVPPGGGETDYSIEANLPAVPQAGDYIMINVPDEVGSRTLIVRQIWWMIQDGGQGANVERLIVECEFARGPFMSESHKAACENYARAGKIQIMEASAF